MKLLKIIKDENFYNKNNLKIREAVRLICLDKNNFLPLLFVKKFNYHKLPGGGIEKKENIENALLREAKEEIGSSIRIISKIGKIIEYRSKWNFKQISYCYLGKILEKGKTKFTRKELNQEFILEWFNLNDALNTLLKDKPKNYEGFFIQKRDLSFLNFFYLNYENYKEIIR